MGQLHFNHLSRRIGVTFFVEKKAWSKAKGQIPQTKVQCLLLVLHNLVSK